MTRIRRRTLRTLVGMHIDFLSDLIKRLDKGANVHKALAEWKRDCGAVRNVDVLFKTGMANRKAGRS